MKSPGRPCLSLEVKSVIYRGQATTEITRTSEETEKIIKTIDEIAAASGEQAQGITQVSQAVAEGKPGGIGRPFVDPLPYKEQADDSC